MQQVQGLMNSEADEYRGMTVFPNKVTFGDPGGQKILEDTLHPTSDPKLCSFNTAAGYLQPFGG